MTQVGFLSLLLFLGLLQPAQTSVSLLSLDKQTFSRSVDQTQDSLGFLVAITLGWLPGGPYSRSPVQPISLWAKKSMSRKMMGLYPKP
jgi:hypothetical protein